MDIKRDTPQKIETPPTVRLRVEPTEANQRLDHYLLHQFPQHSRSYLNKLIAAACIRVEDRQVKAGYRLRAEETISVYFPLPPPSGLVPEEVDFSILYEDAHLLVIAKPPGVVVHPAVGHHSATLVHGLLYHCKGLPEADAGRPGIVHRLDKDTSGIMLVAKNELALQTLMDDFKQRRVDKTYHAVLLRSPREDAGRIVMPIGRHPVQRKKMAVRPQHGKYAATGWQVCERFANGWCLARLNIETGRTHQIRVHMSFNRTPVAGDSLYGGGVNGQLAWHPIRQMLHASTIRFVHPVSREPCTFTAPLWDDMARLLTWLRNDT